MKKLSLAICFMLSLPAMAATEYKRNVPFEMEGSVTHYYGFKKTAEANMWSNAFRVCQELGEAENNDLTLNRLSKVVFSEDNHNATSTAKATFICVIAGTGN